jgi:hypothetical protein
MKLTAVNIALMAIFAALQVLLTTLPFTITLGVSGEITLGVIGGSLIGIILGPLTGGLAVLIGSLVGFFLNPAGALFGPFTALPPFLGAAGAGCVRTQRGYIAGAIIFASLLVFYAHPSGREAFVYSWLHIVAMIVAFSPLAHFAGSAFRAEKTAKPVYGIAVAAFVGVLTDHMAGSSLAIWYFSPMLIPEIWFSAMPIYPIERIAALVLIVLIATPVYYSLAKAGLLNSLR